MAQYITYKPLLLFFFVLYLSAIIVITPVGSKQTSPCPTSSHEYL